MNTSQCLQTLGIVKYIPTSALEGDGGMLDIRAINAYAYPAASYSYKLYKTRPMENYMTQHPHIPPHVG